MAHILKRDKDGSKVRIPIFVDPETGQPDPTKDPDGEALAKSDVPAKYRAEAEDKPKSKGKSK